MLVAMFPLFWVVIRRLLEAGPVREEELDMIKMLQEFCKNESITTAQPAIFHVERNYETVFK